MSEKAKWTKVGSVMKKKDGTGTYIKVANDVVLKKDTYLNIQDPRKRPGITPEQLAKIPDFVKAEIFLAPPRE